MNPMMLTALANMAGVKPEDLQTLAMNAQKFFATALSDLAEIKHNQAIMLELMTNGGSGNNIDYSGTYVIDSDEGTIAPSPN